MPAYNRDGLLELVNSFLGIFELKNSEEIWMQLAEGTEKLHKEKPWDEVKAIANSSYEVADVMNKQG